MLNLVLARLRIEIQSFTKGGNILAEDVKNMVKSCFDFALTKISPHCIENFIGKLPQTYIVVLIMAKKLFQSGAEYTTFERIYNTYKDYTKVNLDQ